MDTTLIKEKIHRLVDESMDMSVLETVEGILEIKSDNYEVPEWQQKIVLDRLNDPNAKYIPVDEALDRIKTRYGFK